MVAALFILGFIAIIYLGGVLAVSGESRRSEFRGEAPPRSARQTDPRALCEIDAINLRLIELDRHLHQAYPGIGSDEVQRLKERARPLVEARAKSDCVSTPR